MAQFVNTCILSSTTRGAMTKLAAKATPIDEVAARYFAPHDLSLLWLGTASVVAPASAPANSLQVS